MAESWQNLDAGFPHISKDEPVKNQVEKMYNYLFQLKQSLRVAFQSMDKTIKRLKDENDTLKREIEQLRTQDT